MITDSEFNCRLNEIKAQVAAIEAETQDVISRLLERQSQIDAAGKSLTSLDFRCQEIRSALSLAQRQSLELRSALAEAKSALPNI
jgi:hypothetical protein